MTCRRWQRKKEARPGEIIEAALKVFVEKGFHAAKVEDIARVAGVTKGTPYLYFRDKEDIFRAVVQSQSAVLLERLAVLPNLHSKSFREMLYLLIETWWSEVGISEASGVLKLLIAEATNFPELATVIYAALIEPVLASVTVILKKGGASGEFRPINMGGAAVVLIAPLQMALLWRHSFLYATDLDARMIDPLHFLHNSLDIMFNGLVAERR